MPLYAYKCQTCSSRRDIFKAIADIDRIENCLKCGFAMNRQLTAPFVQPDVPGYKCPVSGEWIEGRKAHEENLARRGCRIMEDGEADAYRRSVQQDDERLDKLIEEDVGRQIETLPQDKLEKLSAEMDAGLDVSVQRTTYTPN